MKLYGNPPQADKQSQLNGLDSVLTLTREQLPLSLDAYDACKTGSGKATGNSTGSERIDALLAFPRSEWERLRTRTEELKAERATQKQKFK